MTDTRRIHRAQAGCIIYHGPNAGPDVFGVVEPLSCAPDDDVPRPTRRTTVCWRPAEQLLSRPTTVHAPAVLLVDASNVERLTKVRLSREVVLVAADPVAADALGARADVSLVGLSHGPMIQRALRLACELSTTRAALRHQQRLVAQGRYEIHQLKRIGAALMNEHDVPALLHLIVEQGKRLTGSDAAALLLTETMPGEEPTLRLALYESDSVPDIPPELRDMSIRFDDLSIMGHAARTRKPITIADAHHLPPDAGFVRNPALDSTVNYHIRSMLIVPMVNRWNTVVGVLLFVNRKSDRGAKIHTVADVDRFVLQYTGRQARLARALAGQAAISIDNARLYSQIEKIFEAFAKASVIAIDQRDPTTAGHSVRVAALTTALARAVERTDRGPYSDLRFTRAEMRELHFASLLHDFGKIAVHEDTLIKAHKLPPLLWERLTARFNVIERTIELTHCRRRPRVVRTDAARKTAEQIDAGATANRDQLESLLSAVREANEPGVSFDATAGRILESTGPTYHGPGEREMPYITPDELHYLQLPFGTLDARERAEIESHVEATYQYLSRIPWTEDLKHIADYAYGHHEKLDGSGYPRHIAGAAIPVQTRIMTIADIFDALTASDRPYRRALDAGEALNIIQSEANAGRLDSEIVRIMIESRVYQVLRDVDWRQL